MREIRVTTSTLTFFDVVVRKCVYGVLQVAVVHYATTFFLLEFIVRILQANVQCGAIAFKLQVVAIQIQDKGANLSFTHSAQGKSYKLYQHASKIRRKSR